MRSDLHSGCPVDTQHITDMDECFEAYDYLRHTYGWDGGYELTTNLHVYSCDVNQAGKVHFRENGGTSDASGSDDWFVICRISNLLLSDQFQNYCCVFQSANFFRI